MKMVGIAIPQLRIKHGTGIPDYGIEVMNFF